MVVRASVTSSTPAAKSIGTLVSTAMGARFFGGFAMNQPQALGHQLLALLIGQLVHFGPMLLDDPGADRPEHGRRFVCHTIQDVSLTARRQVSTFRSKISVPSRAGIGNSASQCSQRSRVTTRFLPQEAQASFAGHSWMQIKVNSPAIPVKKTIRNQIHRRLLSNEYFRATRRAIKAQRRPIAVWSAAIVR